MAIAPEVLESRIHIGTNKTRQIETNENLLNDFEERGIEVKTRSGTRITDPEQITKILGIKQREIFPGSSYTDALLTIGTEAGRDALKDNDPEKVDILAASTTYFDPKGNLFDPNLPEKNNLAEALKKRLGLPKRVRCFDIHAACPGGVFLLNAIKQREEKAFGKEILFIFPERPKGFLNPNNLFDNAIFTNKGAALKIVYGEDLVILAANAEFDKSDDPGPIRLPIHPRFRSKYPYSVPTSTYFDMDGTGVHRFILEEGPEIIEATIAKAGLTIEDIEKVIIHQANGKSVAGIDRRFPPGKVHICAENGNAGVASVILAGKDALEKKQIGKGSKVVLASWGPKRSKACVVIEILK